MVRYAKLFEVIFQGKLWATDEFELEYLAKMIAKWARPASEAEAQGIIDSVKASFAGIISVRYLNKIIVLGRSKNNEDTYYVLFPVAVWTRNKADVNQYTAGSIERDPDVPGRTSIIWAATGEIRQNDAKRSR